MEDLPRISPVYAAVKTEGQPSHKGIHTPLQPAPSLPSFASFQEHASRSDDAEFDGPEIASMAARLSCYLCSKLRPMVHDVAIAAAELDENVQSYCNKAVTRKLDIPSESPERTVQWVLDRLRYAKGDMVDAARRAQQPAYFFPHPPAPSGLLSRSGSPGNPLKRPAEWERNDYPASKRPRSGDSPDYEGSRAIYDRRASMIDFPTRNAYTPQPTESASHSAYPRTASPSLSGGPLRPLPSPSSVGYPPSAAPSLPPATSYQASASIHTTSTNSVTSASISDLQHQATLKSLSLQSLQSEYSSLLQKLQRERVKSQIIEKKTSVSEQEVNDLTGRNEELTEHVRTLEIQLEESERKRDNERADATKEKEQWGRMLDMSNRLQAKLAVERQSLAEERDELRRRATGLEDQVKVRQPSSADPNPKISAARQDSGSADRHQSPYAERRGDVPGDVALKREIDLQKARIEVLTSTLQEVKRQTLDLDKKSRYIMQRSGEVERIISTALHNEENGSLNRGVARPEAAPNAPSIVAVPSGVKSQQCQTAPPIVVSTTSPPQLAPLAAPKYSSTSRTGLPTPTSATGPSIAEMASAGRAVSPGPEELGIKLQPSTSSPEELIKALGPVPAPLPAHQFHGSSSYGQTFLQARRQSHSPPEIRQGYMHASPYAHVPSTYTNQRTPFARPGASPPLDGGSPDSAGDGESPPRVTSSAKRLSPDSTTSGRPREDNRSFSDNATRHTDSSRRFPDMAKPPATGLASFRQWSHDTRQGDAAAAMPPPPRPFSSSHAVAFGQTPGV